MSPFARIFYSVTLVFFLQVPYSAPKWESSIVELEIGRVFYNVLQPWNRSQSLLQASGLIIEGKKILTLASSLENASLVRVKQGGRGRWWTGRVLWKDVYTNIAVITVEEPEFWQKAQAVTLSKSTPLGARLELKRWNNRQLETWPAEIIRYSMEPSYSQPTQSLYMEVTCDVDKVGISDVLLYKKSLAGLAVQRSGKRLLILPSSYIAWVLNELATKSFKGLGYIHFKWQIGANPQTMEALSNQKGAKGIIISRVPAIPKLDCFLKSRDILVSVNGHALDFDGDYQDKQFGQISFESLAAIYRQAGDTLLLELIRAGKTLKVVYTLPPLRSENFTLADNPGDLPSEYFMLEGLVFQPLKASLLSVLSPGYSLRLQHYASETPKFPGADVILLTQVLPDSINLGYQNYRFLVLDSLNSKAIHGLDDIAKALVHPQNGFHQFKFATGEPVESLVLPLDSQHIITERIMRSFGIPKAQWLNEKEVGL